MQSRSGQWVVTFTSKTLSEIYQPVLCLYTTETPNTTRVSHIKAGNICASTTCSTFSKTRRSPQAASQEALLTIHVRDRRAGADAREKKPR